MVRLGPGCKLVGRESVEARMGTPGSVGQPGYRRQDDLWGWWTIASTEPSSVGLEVKIYITNFAHGRQEMGLIAPA